MWALRDGIWLCISLKLLAVIIELDVQLLVDLLKKDDGQPNSNEALVSYCKAGFREIPMIRVQHYFRKANKCVNTLVRRGALLS